ncbi:MAG: hypothetical protein SCL54_06465 [Bacillota bacterium]|nr:hypothetical protein [Bacillota bacterium]
MKRFLKNEVGGVLPLVMMIFMVLFILGVSLLQIGMSDTVQSTWQSNRVQAHYLARSGIEIGDEMLKDKLTTFPQTGTLAELVAELNAATSSVYTIAGVGDFTINFSVTPLSEIKIDSVGTTTMANPKASSTVTFTKKLFKATYDDAGSKWFHNNGFNLAPYVFPDEVDPETGELPNTESFLGRIAYLGNQFKTTQTPSVGSGTSVFRASIAIFGEFDDISVDAIANSKGAIDAEIIFFDGSIFTKNKTELALLVSDKVIAQKTSTEYDPYYPNPSGVGSGGLWNLDFMEYDNIVGTTQVLEGFESEDRYIALINNLGGTPTTDYRPASSTFKVGVKYGIVRLVEISNMGTVVLEPSENNTKGYYYFPNGTSIGDEAAVGINYEVSDLIEIDDDDPITGLLDNMFRWDYDSGSGIWNYQ